LVDPESAESIAGGLRRLLEDPELWARNGKKGFVRSLEFSEGRTVDNYLALYERLIRSVTSFWLAA